MRIDHVRILLMLLGALVTMGCNAQSPVNSSPSTSQGTAGNSRADAPGVAKPSSELSQAAAVGSTSDSPKVAKPSSGLRQAAAGSSTSDSPKVARSSSATDDSAGVGRRQDDGSQAASSAQPSNRTVPRASVKPSAEQIAKWGIPEFEPLALLACRDGFAEPALLGMAISPSGKQFVLAGAKLTLWNAKDPQPAAELLAKYKTDELERPLSVVAISDDGKWIAAGDQKGRVRIWSLSDQREVLMLPADPSRGTQLAFSPNSRLLATTSYSDEFDIDLWQLPDGKPMKSLKISKEEITRLVFLSDNLLAAASREMSLWDVASGKKVTFLTTKLVRYPALALSRDRRVLAFNDSDENVQFWDVGNSRLTGVTVRGVAVGPAAFSRDGKWLATYSGDRAIRICDTAKGCVVQVIDAGGDRTTALEWFPNANVLLVASLAGRIRMWGTAEGARSIGVEPMLLPALPATAAGARRSLSSAQFQRVIDLRSFPRLPGAVPHASEFAIFAYTAPASQEEAALFYRYVLGKSGWKEVPVAAAPGMLAFRKNDCELTVWIYPADAGGDKNLEISLSFLGNYDARWLPRISAIDSKSDFHSFFSVSYRTKASLLDTEVAVLRRFHEAGWTAYSELARSGSQHFDRRDIQMLQGGSVLSVSISHPNEPTEELAVQTSVRASDTTLPIPPDAGWIGFDNSTDLQLLINTKMDLAHTAQFYDERMAAEGWLARDTGRQIKEDKGWLPYIRGQQDVLIGLSARPGEGTRIVVGETEGTSWQFQAPVEAKKQTDQPGFEAADFAVPSGATAVKFDVDEKVIEFEVADTTPPKLGGQIAAQMEAIGWKRGTAGVMGDEYVSMSFAKGKAEIELHVYAAVKAINQATKARINGDGLLWGKPLPVAAVPIPYETWLRRNRKDATLDRLDEFAAEMHKIQAASKRK